MIDKNFHTNFLPLYITVVVMIIILGLDTLWKN
jgi:hypothetical protein